MSAGEVCFLVATNLLLVVCGWMLGESWAAMKAERAYAKKERAAFIRYYKSIKAAEALKARREE